jgi:hypothetical protein
MADSETPGLYGLPAPTRYIPDLSCIVLIVFRVKPISDDLQQPDDEAH